VQDVRRTDGVVVGLVVIRKYFVFAWPRAAKELTFL